MKPAVKLAVLCALLLSANCADGTPEINPAPVTNDAGPAAGGTSLGGAGGQGNAGSAGEQGGSGSGGDTGSAGQGDIIRTVTFRDVFAGAAIPNNLMLDGGFEFSGVTSTTWVDGHGHDVVFSHGVKCRHGIRCANIKETTSLTGVIASPREGVVQLTIYASPTAQKGCDHLSFHVFDTYGGSVSISFTVTSASIGADGWCEIVSQAPAFPYVTPMLMIDAASEAVVDDIMLVAVTSAHSAMGLSPPAPVSEPTRAKIRQAAFWARQMLDRSRKRSVDPKRAAPWTAQFPAWIR